MPNNTFNTELKKLARVIQNINYFKVGLSSDDTSDVLNYLEEYKRLSDSLDQMNPQGKDLKYLERVRSACPESLRNGLFVFVNKILKSEDEYKKQIKKTVTSVSEVVNAMDLNQLANELAPMLTAGTKDALALIDDATEINSNALVAVLLNSLLSLNADSQISVDLVKQLKDLQNGSITHLSLLTQVDGLIKGIHVDIRALLRNPIQIISDLTFSLYKMGVRKNEHLVMKLTTFEQTKALLMLDGFTVTNQTLADVANNALVVASNNALVEATAKANPLSNDEIIELIKAVLIINKTADVLRNDKQALSAPVQKTTQRISLPVSLKNMFVQGHIEPLPLQIGAPGVAQIAKPAKATKVADVTLSAKTEEALPMNELNKSGDDKKKVVKPTVKITAIDLKQHEADFNNLLKQLKQIKSHIETKYTSNSSYEAAYDSVLRLDDSLKSAAEKFFGNPATPESFIKFKTKCEFEIQTAQTEFDKHREFWHTINPILKGFLGVIATLTVIPALVVTFTSGYSNTFFSTPATTSGRELKALKAKFDAQDEQLQSAIPGCAGL